MTSFVERAGSGALAAELVENWKELLDCEDVGPGDYFLDLGGDSLLATILANRVEDAFGFRPCLEQIFELSFAELTAYIEDEIASE
jgi:acyl carrier protein